jgi:hypothetical protein
MHSLNLPMLTIGLVQGAALGGGRVRQAPPVPTTSIFGRSDGIVAWRCCVQEPGPLAESVEVAASHIGMGLHPATWFAVADRLAQREGRWAPFHREGWRQWLYRDPYRADAQR